MELKKQEIEIEYSPTANTYDLNYTAYRLPDGIENSGLGAVIVNIPIADVTEDTTEDDDCACLAPPPRLPNAEELVCLMLKTLVQVV